MDNAEARRRGPHHRVRREVARREPRARRAILAVGSLASIVLAMGAFAPPTGAADASLALLQLPVAGTRPVAAEDYRAAQEVAKRGGAPVEIALSIAGPFQGAAQAIVQVNEGSEAPSASRVAVLRDGLLDDAVGSERWDVTLRRTSAGTWAITEVTRAWRCRRGGAPDRFAAALCP